MRPVQLIMCILMLSGCTFALKAQTPYEAAFEARMQEWYPGTGLVYECPIDQVCSSEGAKGNFLEYTKERGYGHGMEDCALICGTALSGLSDLWQTGHEPAIKKDARLLAEGMLNLAGVHGAKGFVARGICPDDCKTVCSLSSRDQYTHWVHSLWRFSESGMATKKMVREYRQRISEVAAFMEETITEENGFNFGQPDGSRPASRAICTMWGPTLKPHEHMRLPMIYSAAYMATGDAHWKDMYERYIDEALQKTLAVTEDPTYPQLGYMPCYSLYQAAASMEVVLAFETDPSRSAGLREAIHAFAAAARLRMEQSVPWNPPYGMCWDGELLLTQLIDPAFCADEVFLDHMDASLGRNERGKPLPDGSALGVGWCRVAHLCSASWRLKAVTSYRK